MVLFVGTLKLLPSLYLIDSSCSMNWFDTETMGKWNLSVRMPVDDQKGR